MTRPPARKKPIPKPKTKPSRILQEELPILNRGDRTSEGLCLAIAHALTQWEMLDETLAMIFARLTQSKGGAAEAAYGIVASHATRREMVVAAAEAVFSAKHPIRVRLISLLGEIGKLSGKRNNIAHGVICRFAGRLPTPGGRSGRAKSFGHFLVPPDYNTRKRISRQALQESMMSGGDYHRRRKYAYTASQVRRLGKTFARYNRKAFSAFDEIEAEMKRRYPPLESLASALRRMGRGHETDQTKTASAGIPSSRSNSN